MAFQGDSIYWVEVEKIVPNPFQPRREFDEQKLKELSESIRMYGVLQPLTVTRQEIQRDDGTFYTEYELIAGERRLRASKLAGLSQVPVIIREGEDNEQEKLELAIIENLQREDLNAVDRALAFKQLAEVFGLSHGQVAKKVGRSREYVSNSIRLLGLPEYMLNSLRLGEMTEGHSRTLLMLNDRPEEQDVVFREILLKKMSVRETERIVRKIATDKVRKRDDVNFDTELIEIEKRFMETLGTRVQIQKTDFGGKLTIDYFSVEDLEEMLSRMKDHQRQMSQNNEQIGSIDTHTPITIMKEDEEVSSKVDEALLYPEPSRVTESRVENKPTTPTEPIRETFASEMSQVGVETQNFAIPPQPKVETNNFAVSQNNQPVYQYHQPAPEKLIETVHHEQIANHQPDGYLPTNANQNINPPQNHYPTYPRVEKTESPAPIQVSAPVPYPVDVQKSEGRHYQMPQNHAPAPMQTFSAQYQPSITQPSSVSNGANAPLAPLPKIEVPKIEDDSDLYSIKNFPI